ncbi:NTF2-like protein [Dacryopinax primogenitus]|uniref:NTF2-like protein n=1 Tax=Dacryopinax primogenitus (strain DJM 731) TaxID=1858805 RepID=M5FX65_DACPD|nr:NTF2-like protein [Dacryopinax primogenitus]EJU02576.1 NTF2-like protein [Dacryopinax primogenitus]
MPPLAAAAIRSAIDPSNRPGGSLLDRLSPAPSVPNAPSRIPTARGGGRGGHQRTNGISVRGAAPRGGGPGGRKPLYVKNENVELADRAADDFVAVFYSNMDSTGRASLAKMYRPSSTLIWNGNKMQGVESINDFFSKLPPSKHDLNSYNCHPIPGTEGLNDRKPSLMLVASGSVTHGKEPVEHAVPKYYPVADALPRAFCQTFVLCPDIEGSGLPPDQWKMVDRYYIISDHLRFID